MKKIKFLFILFLWFSPHSSWSKDNSNTNLIYSEFANNFLNPVKIGGHNLKVFGLKIYLIELFSDEAEFSYENNFAIVINYQRNFSKNRLVERSIQEISRLNNIQDKALLSNYEKKLNEIFSDVKKGDRKTAYFNPKKGLKLYFNGQLVGQIDDLVFAQRFVDIWLNSNSAYPQMTKDIIAKNE
ncbi:MAG: hypothetical protein EBT63_01380 [Proteobacteria bacterium]|nr:hypothetical protein [Pseudomonadota bacterium]NCA28496.1 hypothetical protein [Pseudomonadota bacterium]